ncbi:tail assembly chaperone gp38 [Enterobacter cancerogenus]|uniref:Tail assembly chaperone gp38 n=1 Tax=Enterobacter cancerogenus TaxID=69218 RepID=A0A484XQ75_9ENTR|nr:tail assembly chaperone gp38 [Enterobacter cancerogenus]
MSYFFSAKELGFFYAEVNEDIPEDAIEISSEAYNILIEAQGDGKTISSDSNGNPILTEPVIDWSQKAESQRQSLLTAANDTIADWKIELQLDVISDDDKASLIKWMAYVKQLKALEFTDIIDNPSFDAISWPPLPS